MKEKITDAIPVMTSSDTMICPIAKPAKNFRPSLKENEAPTPAKASTAGPGVMIRKKTAKQKASIIFREFMIKKLKCRQSFCRHYPPKLNH